VNMICLVVPEAVVFMNAGARLTVEGADSVPGLARLEKKGVRIFVCGTCLDFFGLKERVRAGTVSNVYGISEALLGASHVVTLELLHKRGKASKLVNTRDFPTSNSLYEGQSEDCHPNGQVDRKGSQAIEGKNGMINYTAQASLTVVMPQKKTKGKELSQKDTRRNKDISFLRVCVEHAIGGAKPRLRRNAAGRRFRIVCDLPSRQTGVYRNLKRGCEDTVMEIACGLWELPPPEKSLTKYQERVIFS